MKISDQNSNHDVSDYGVIDPPTYFILWIDVVGTF